MKAVIMTGPTLKTHDIIDFFMDHGHPFKEEDYNHFVFKNGHEFTILPPAQEGDIYKVVQKDDSHIIGIIDGYFESTSAIWHKEILYALTKGRHVYGAASMGALRAAELSYFGMKGVGDIFECYDQGVYEDDDEVTLLHGPEQADYPPFSEAMANIRATLQKAVEHQIIDKNECDILIKLAKATFYKDRNYKNLFEKALHSQSIEAQRIEHLKAWVDKYKVDQKKIDALKMIEIIFSDMCEGTGPHQADFDFQHTSVWQQAISQHK